METTEKLFVVADLSEVWVTAKIPKRIFHTSSLIWKEMDRRWKCTWPPIRDRFFHGRITYVRDVLDPATRTMRLSTRIVQPRTQAQTLDVCHGPRLFRTTTRDTPAIRNGRAARP